MPELRPHLKKYLQYVVNTDGNASIDDFDDDWEPIGPLLRSELVPVYMVAGENGKLKLTAEGIAALEQSND